MTLLLEKRFKVISLDNYHNSYPTALSRASQIARDALPQDASDQDRDSTEVDVVSLDLTDGNAIRGVFEKYGKGGIHAVIHIAVSV